jgi:tetratricopeptide (TPR) repeat protein
MNLGYWMSKIFSPIIFITTLSLIISNGCSDSDSRKIKLAESGDVGKTSSPAGTSILKAAPEEQKTLVVRYFKNHTGDPSLDWLERGLTDMLITDLSQSPYLNIITESQFIEVARKMGKKVTELDDLFVGAKVAAEAKAQILLTGCISFQEDLVKIEVDATDAITGAEIVKEMVEGEGLEKLFSMVDELSGKLRQFLREKGQEQKFASVNLSQMTSSLEAFRCFSKALENKEKYIYAEAEECLEEALHYDSTFASAYLHLIGVKRALKKPVNPQEFMAKTKRYAHKLSFADKVKLEILENELRGEPYRNFSILEEAVKNSPMDIDLRFTLAQQYRMWGHENKAMLEYEELLEMDPKHKMAYNDLGYLYANMGDFETALYMLDKYQALAPDEPNPHDSKGEILMFTGRLEEASEEYKKALSIMPGYYNSAFKLSEIYMELGDQKKALQYLNQGVKYVPDTGFERNSDFLRARIYWRFGDIDKADKYFTSLLEKHPLASGYLIRRKEMYSSAGKEDLAQKFEIESFNKYIESLNNSTGTYYHAPGFFEFITYSDLSLEKVMPVIGKVISRLDQSNQALNMKWAEDYYNLYLGHTEQAKNSFKEKMPLLMLGLNLRKSEVGWGSTWKNMFIFFDVESGGGELSKIFSNYILELADKEGRKDLEFISGMSQARVFGRENKTDEYVQLYKHYGVALEETWKICGPFREFRKFGFNHAFPPEKEIKLLTTYKNNKNNIIWIDGQDKHRDGHVNLLDILPQSSFATAYALVYINSPDERKVQIRIGSDEGCKFWLNDELIWQHYIKRSAVVDRDILTVVLHPGYNKVLLKITNTDLDWGFYFRVTDEKGDGFSDLKFVSPDELESNLASKLPVN